jgi:hypothetical protein
MYWRTVNKAVGAMSVHFIPFFRLQACMEEPQAEPEHLYRVLEQEVVCSAAAAAAYGQIEKNESL